MSETQHCPSCDQDLPMESFHRDKLRISGRKTYCKACDKARYYAKRNAARTTEEGRRARSAWNRTREFSQAKRLREARHSSRYIERYPEKAMATRTVRRAIVSGALIRPAACDECRQSPPPIRGGNPAIHAHHDDYSKPLHVRWLCIDCHAAHHRSALSQKAKT